MATCLFTPECVTTRVRSAVRGHRGAAHPPLWLNNHYRHKKQQQQQQLRLCHRVVSPSSHFDHHLHFSLIDLQLFKQSNYIYYQCVSTCVTQKLHNNWNGMCSKNSPLAPTTHTGILYTPIHYECYSKLLHSKIKLDFLRPFTEELWWKNQLRGVSPRWEWLTRLWIDHLHLPVWRTPPPSPSQPP